ncbi:unnamed protein product, partial [Symbiodinium sp. KB8]
MAESGRLVPYGNTSHLNRSVVDDVKLRPNRAGDTNLEAQEATQPWDGVPAPSSFDDDLEKELERLIFEEETTEKAAEMPDPAGKTRMQVLEEEQAMLKQLYEEAFSRLARQKLEALDEGKDTATAEEAEKKRQAAAAAEKEAEKKRQAAAAAEEAEKKRLVEALAAAEAEKNRQAAAAAEAEKQRQAAAAAEEAERKRQAAAAEEAEKKRQAAAAAAEEEAEKKRQAAAAAEEAEKNRQAAAAAAAAAEKEAEKKRQAAAAASAED